MPIGRRDFITTAAVAGSAQLLGTSRAWAGANDRIRVAVIGMGGRGRDHMRDCAKISGVEVAAFCDPDETRMAQRSAEFEKLTGSNKVASNFDVGFRRSWLAGYAVYGNGYFL